MRDESEVRRVYGLMRRSWIAALDTDEKVSDTAGYMADLAAWVLCLNNRRSQRFQRLIDGLAAEDRQNQSRSERREALADEVEAYLESRP